MKTFRCSFAGRTIGAIGRSYNITATVEAEDADGAREALYEKYEHIDGLQCAEQAAEADAPADWGKSKF